MHAITGQLAWPTRPESIAIDARTAIVDLTLDGRSESPSRNARTERVWLGKQRTAEQPARMEVQVYRLLQDTVPAQLVTRIRLQVSGDGREELLARVLPDGFTPVSLASPLPARLEPDGRLRVQVRAGSWDVDIEARGGSVAGRIARPPAAEGLWAKEEVWSFASDDRLRVADAQGADGIDPAQANVPPEWRGFPAYRMARGLRARRSWSAVAALRTQTTIASRSTAALARFRPRGAHCGGSPQRHHAEGLAPAR